MLMRLLPNHRRTRLCLLLCVESPAGQVSRPFRQADTASLNQRKHHPATGGQMG